jgi:hypothetical protein
MSMAVNRFRVESALMRSAVVALTVLTLTLIGSPELAAQQEGSDVSTQSADDDTAQKKKKKKEKKQKAEGEEKKGPSLLPVPIFITEPAIGYGLGAAVGYFHKKKDVDTSDQRLPPGMTATSASDTGKSKKQPPTISGIAAGYTDKGSWGLGIGHFGNWAKDTIRYRGALGYVNIESEFWFLNRPFEFNVKGGLLFQDINFRMGKSDFWLGGRLIYVNTDLKFKVDPPSDDRDPIESRGRNLQDLGLAFQAIYEGLDNLTTPNTGQYVELVTTKYFESTISDFDYFKAGFRVLSFHQFAKDKLVLGLRFDIDATDGDPPLWGYPWIVLRGVPALRYQNERTGVVEAELRWNILDRWAILGFAGAGRTSGDVRRFVDESGIYAGGIGARYLFRPQDDLWVGVDLARGPEQYVFYIQVGHAW